MAPILGHISALTITIQASAALTAHQLVGLDGAPAGAGEPIIGVARTACEAGDDVAVDVLGVMTLTAAAAINQGDAVASDANGAPVANAVGSFGYALTTAANPGDLVSVLIK